jgi:hypothetical protein
MVEYMDDVKNSVWSELKTKKPVTIYRRNLQKNYITSLFENIKEAEAGTHYMALLFGGPRAEEELPVTVGSDIGSYLALHVKKLRTEILAVLPLIKDIETQDHLHYISEQIETGLNNRFNK